MTAGEEILGVFERRRAAALFVTELAHALRVRADSAELAADLARLERDGAIVVTDHVSPDPHLAGIDLRIVAPLAADAARADAEARAADAAEALWNRWLASFLSSHRCQ